MKRLLPKLPYLLMLCILTQFSCKDSLVERGNACLNLGDYQMAEMFFEKALIDNPLNFDARLGYAKALLQHIVDIPSDSSLWRKSLINFEAALDIKPSSDLNSLISDVWYERAMMLLTHRDTLGAISALSRSIEINAKNCISLNTIGILYFKQGDTNKAEALFRSAVAIDSTHAQAFFNLGMVYWSKNNYEDAKKFWLTASKLSPDDNDMVYWLAKAEKLLQEQHK
ncbi:MAG: tetratricopeptide repeat protein [Fibrobacter sp.]|nr:tetratricopeptide repeat protein [Fibrobacter sp.]